jgi:selenocysteine lyase/cysteine desulfurase
MSSLSPLDPSTEVRPHFPALAKYPDFTFADNAGGSQILQSSLDLISDYLITSNVQLGGGYPHSADAGKRVEEAKRATEILTNVQGGDAQVVLGSSTTQLATNLAQACGIKGKLEGLFVLGDEIVVTAADHEGQYLTGRYESPRSLETDITAYR